MEIQTIYAVKINREMTDQESHRLMSYLETGEVNSSPNQSANNAHALQYYVVPRLGTTSPWSTKATDIANSCGLDFVEKIEHGLYWNIASEGKLNDETVNTVFGITSDPLTESILSKESALKDLFNAATPKALFEVDILNNGIQALNDFDAKMQLAISQEEKEYLYESYLALQKNPTDAELMMFSQVNSEHCRHKIFNASWTIDGEEKERSLFSMIRNTHQLNPEGTIVAYKDNASVIKGSTTNRYMMNSDHEYVAEKEEIHILTKVETHNHPTAISPFSGAATGSGGEIRDEGATGRGSKPKAGLTGYTVSNLRLPNHPREWEIEEAKPKNICTPLQIMLDAPIGGASFNNEFGRPNLTGYFRTFEQNILEDSNKRWGYHKPIMIAGGLGNIRDQHVEKNHIPEGSKLVVLGGPAMLIGLGGGAASSVGSGQSDESLDFASVQRGNPEMQRRCQEVIDACWALGENNPIVSIHDVGAGGLSNALPEIINDANLGGKIELRKILNEDIAMSPMEIWCNEAQERYVLAINADHIEAFEKICQRERSLYCVVGEATTAQELCVSDELLSTNVDDRQPVDIPMSVLFGNPPKMHRNAEHYAYKKSEEFNSDQVNDADFISSTLKRVLRSPAVADKTFLITIGDRSVTGLVARDQMVGPWQVPVADVAVTLSGYEDNYGEAMSMGERTPLAVHNGPASARMAVAEAITNVAAAKIEKIGDIKLSANWMAASAQKGQDASLYDTVQALGMEICPEIGVSIPVGKDSMSMRCNWQDEATGNEQTALSPVSLIISAFTPVTDVTKTLTPELKLGFENELLLIDLGAGKNRLGASIAEQVYNYNSGDCADIDNAKQLLALFNCIQELNETGIITAYHDRSDGGLIVALLEMAFASRAALDIDLNETNQQNALASLFNEEAGVVLQIAKENKSAFNDIVAKHGLNELVQSLGEAKEGDKVAVSYNGNMILNESRTELHRVWSETTWQMQCLRDNPECADQEYDRILDESDQGMQSKLSFDLASIQNLPKQEGTSPKVAILREQGTNGHLEMAKAFEIAGFQSIDVHMSDLIEGRVDLSDFAGFAACGGFSYGDVLGAGRGWANSILFNDRLRQMFSDFFADQSKFALGVCNGCQMIARLKEIIPGTDNWPTFERNYSEQYEARQILVEIPESKSIFFDGMAGSVIPLVIGHGEGRAEFSHSIPQDKVAMRFVDNQLSPAVKYPLNPNGSPEGITGLTNDDGRITIMMPHPERVVRTVNHSYQPDEWKQHTYSPWLKMFQNARKWTA